MEDEFLWLAIFPDATQLGRTACSNAKLACWLRTHSAEFSPKLIHTVLQEDIHIGVHLFQTSVQSNKLSSMYLMW